MSFTAAARPGTESGGGTFSLAAPSSMVSSDGFGGSSTLAVGEVALSKLGGGWVDGEGGGGEGLTPSCANPSPDLSTYGVIYGSPAGSTKGLVTSR